nr:radical SAM protein [Candidatus Gracilibacteria bacterium]
MKRLEFHISYICNHNCIFCSEYDRLQKYRTSPLTILQIKTILVDRRKQGFNHVNFTGGEPTIISGFLELLKFTKKLGYKIYVGTNGTMFAGENFAKEALKYIDELSLSIHWYDEETVKKQTGLKNHFDIYKNYISKNIIKYKTNNNFFFSNIVLNKYNYQNIMEIIKFIKSTYIDVKQILISNIAPEGLADHTFSELVFDLYEFKKYIPEIVNYCNENSLTLRFFGLPTCILGELYYDYSNDEHWEERHTIERFTTKDGKIVLKDIYSPDNSRKRTFVEMCNDCKWKTNPCTGIFRKYLEYYKF